MYGSRRVGLAGLLTSCLARFAPSEESSFRWDLQLFRNSVFRELLWRRLKGFFLNPRVRKKRVDDDSVATLEGQLTNQLAHSDVEHSQTEGAKDDNALAVPSDGDFPRRISARLHLIKSLLPTFCSAR